MFGFGKQTNMVTVIQRVGESPAVFDPLHRQEPLRFMESGVVCPKPIGDAGKEGEFGFVDIVKCVGCREHASVSKNGMFVNCKFQRQATKDGDVNGTTKPDA